MGDEAAGPDPAGADPADANPKSAGAGLDRRGFLRLAGSGLAGLALGACSGRGSTGAAAPAILRGRPDVVVVGAGAFGGWTALHLQEMGADVLLVDKYGPGNSRATSGGETRGVRTSYGDRPHGLLWARWGREAIRRWRAWDRRWGEEYLPRLFFPTGDLIFRAESEPFLERSMEAWDQLDVPYEVLDPDEVRRRWSAFDLEGIGTVLHEPDAGVVRARRAMESVAEVFRHRGGDLWIGRADPADRAGGRLSRVRLTPGEPVSAGQYVFACGPWLPKVFPEVMGDRVRIPLGHSYYFGAPEGDPRWNFPNLPSWNFPGVTGWPALSLDNRGFRVRTGGRPEQDPDLSQRTVDPEFHEQPREFLAERFPDLRDAPILETRACHYELSPTRNFIIDRHPEMENVWIAGGGSAEAFKFGPVSGEYVARRVLKRSIPDLFGEANELAEGFRIPEETFGTEA